MGLAAVRRPVVILLADDLSVERTLIIYVPVTTQNLRDNFQGSRQPSSVQPARYGRRNSSLASGPSLQIGLLSRPGT